MNGDEIARAAATQADREAAASNIKRRLVWQHGGEQPWMDASTASMRLGEQDDHDEVQAFTRHRLAAAPDPAPSGLEQHFMGEVVDTAPREVEANIASLRALSDWLIANDYDMLLPEAVSRDPKEAAYMLSALTGRDGERGL